MPINRDLDQGLAGFLGAMSKTVRQRQAEDRARQHARAMVTHQISAQEQAMKDRYGKGGLFEAETGALGKRSAAEWGGGDVDPATGLPIGGFRLNELKAKGLMGEYAAGLQFDPTLGRFYKREEAMADVLGPGGPRERQAAGQAAIQKKFGGRRGAGPSTKPLDPVRNPEYAAWINEEAKKHITAAGLSDSEEDYREVRQRVERDHQIPEYERNLILERMDTERANTLARGVSPPPGAMPASAPGPPSVPAPPSALGRIAGEIYRKESQPAREFYGPPIKSAVGTLGEFYGPRIKSALLTAGQMKDLAVEEAGKAYTERYRPTTRK